MPSPIILDSPLIGSLGSASFRAVVADIAGRFVVLTPEAFVALPIEQRPDPIAEESGKPLLIVFIPDDPS